MKTFEMEWFNNNKIITHISLLQLGASIYIQHSVTATKLKLINKAHITIASYT